LHPLGSADDHAFIIEDAELTTLVHDPGMFEDRAGEMAGRIDGLKLLGLGPTSAGRDLLALADEQPGDVGEIVATENDVAGVFYTGGTTGRPKGVVHPGRSLLYSAVLALAEWQLPQTPRFMACTPISHAAGAIIPPVLMRGGTIVLLPSFDPAQVLATIERQRVDTMFLVPTMIYVLLDHPDLRKHDLGSLETMLYGAAPMSSSRLGEAMDVFGKKFIQGYGQTEATATVTVLPKQDHDVNRPDLLGSCGRAMRGVRAGILDDEGNRVQGGDIGELCVRGRVVMDRYWRQPELTAEAFRGGWLRTGDIARRDAEGYITLVDRAKDMIISGGFNVYPREIEDVLSAHPAVASVAVIGVPDNKWGEAVKAVVVVRPGAEVPAEELMALVRDKKGPVYAPKSVDFVEQIPLTAVGKADKKALRAPYWAGMERQVH
jgi:fatty-acyl-CoA synthase